MIRRHLAGAAVLCGLLLWAPSAPAWQPLDECSPGVFSHWNQRPVGYKLNELGSDDLVFGDVETIIADSWATWQSVCCSTFMVRYDGTTTEVGTDESIDHIISFEENAWPPELGDPSSVLGITLTSQTAGCVLSSADIIFNGVVFTWINGTPGSSVETDLQSVATHEQGHWLGLGHSAVPSSTLWPTYDNGIATRALDPDDVAGICALYLKLEDHCTDDNDDDCDGLIDCADPDCVVEPACTCSATSVIECEIPLSDDTSALPVASNLDSYPCSGKVDDGPERAYRFTPTFHGSVTVDLAGFTGPDDLDLLFMEGGCNPANCSLAFPQDPGVAEQLVDVPVIGNTDYFLVVDTAATGAGAAFDLTVTCNRVSEAACDNGADDDEDLDIDCDDVDCDGQTCGPGGATCVAAACFCPGNEPNETTCDDGIDNDCDGFTDCGDSTCAGEPCDGDGRQCIGIACDCPGGAITEVTCDDGQDNDCDLDIDCDDDDCFAQTCGLNGRLCTTSTDGGVCICPGGQVFETACLDGEDNDCDGDLDCDDTDCEGIRCNGIGHICRSTVCVCEVNETAETTCYDGFDNDCDTLLDCVDPDCMPAFPLEQICFNNQDDDCDGDTDCDDSDCEDRAACAPATELDCSDGVDDDFDNDTDCEDIDCTGDPCGPGGAVCEALECSCPGGEAVEVSCDDELDNDCDGETDCDDSDCLEACTPGGDAGPAGGDSDSPGDSDGTPPGGCGCASSQGSSAQLGWMGLLLIGFVWRRRR